MRIVIVGAGRAGLEVAIHLTRTGHAVTIIDNDERVTRRASEQYGVVALSGDATIAAVLDEANIRQSDVVVAMLRRDADNLAHARRRAAEAGVKHVTFIEGDITAPRPARSSTSPLGATCSCTRTTRSPQCVASPAP